MAFTQHRTVDDVLHDRFDSDAGAWGRAGREEHFPLPVVRLPPTLGVLGTPEAGYLRHLSGRVVMAFGNNDD